MLDQITPLILTSNEAPNIGRTLGQLRWARDIVVVDSFSDDETLEIVADFPQTRIFQRKFDDHATQWNFGLNETGIGTEWVLALDADHIPTEELIEELKSLQPAANTQGYRARFTYCINGRPLRSGVYPLVTVLYRRSLAKYSQDGHTHRLVLGGEVEGLRSRILHDDRKSLRRWFESQQRYMSLEAKKILASDSAQRSTAERIRQLRVIAPVAVLFYCLFVRGGILDGWPGWFYAFQRMFAEVMLSLYLIDHDINSLGQRRPTSEAQRHREQSTLSKEQRAPSTPALLAKAAVRNPQSEN